MWMPNSLTTVAPWVPSAPEHIHRSGLAMGGGDQINRPLWSRCNGSGNLLIDQFCSRLIETPGTDGQRTDDIVVLRPRTPLPDFHRKCHRTPTRWATYAGH